MKYAKIREKEIIHSIHFFLVKIYRKNLFGLHIFYILGHKLNNMKSSLTMPKGPTTKPHLDINAHTCKQKQKGR